MTTGEMWDVDARREISELRATVEEQGRVTAAAIESVLAYLRAHEQEQRAVAKVARETAEDLDAIVAKLGAAVRRQEIATAALDRRDADIATSVARIATTGGATGGGVVAAIVSIALGLLHGCDPVTAPEPVGQHGSPTTEHE